MAPRVKFDPALLPERPNLSFENALWERGVRLVAGIDEAGRGALAGPVAVGAVILPNALPDLMTRLSGIRDSKVMQPNERKRWATEVKAFALACGLGLATPEEIDQLGIAPATRLAAARALDSLKMTSEH